MPSLRRPQLVASVAGHLATLGRLVDLGALSLTTDEPTSGPGGNSAFRLAAVHDRFAVSAELAGRLAALDGPVLLVDDLVDSRWTITVAGAALRQAGAPGVLPFALAVAA
jgi:ATP-dependent DNA helicase RecQ